ncbi:hypothetical protein F4827_006625 [Paraburkholderia bannensis]|uniref:Uncharacterized protein n=1 Tax=Paraburkholderia bannensis TaxID=765414 RepID=A0A7W9U4C2_9BURK|nr:MULTISPECIES: hypothetical protein [Paraburkholderia]MBB3261751.1 hypothetical protein [Paraburkholderia sp. WP4_3_2]MBB6106749.1 hypothetical protein [Paraburkholderia bannensis]
MTISSIGNNSVARQYYQTQNIPKGGEAGEVGPDMDGDADDGGARATPPASTPTVNSSGQTIGQLINIRA